MVKINYVNRVNCKIAICILKKKNERIILILNIFIDYIYDFLHSSPSSFYQSTQCNINSFHSISSIQTLPK